MYISQISKRKEQDDKILWLEEKIEDLELKVRALEERLEDNIDKTDRIAHR